jgi:hypothetical protein
MDLSAALDALKVPPDVGGTDSKDILWTHREADGADIYFLSNQREKGATISPVFRVHGKAPELWQAETGRGIKTAVFAAVDGGVCVPIHLEARGSVFVVFREAAGEEPTVTEVRKDGQVLLSTVVRSDGEPAASRDLKVASTFTLAGWLRPGAEIDLPAEADSGVALLLRRNDAIFPAHGDTLFPGGGHAGAGISAGRNGVCVYEHSANYFAPLLVHAAALEGWTHVAVIYRDGRPSLYLNCGLARTGLKSRFTVHPSGPDSTGPGGPFKGDLGEFQEFGRALTEPELSALVRSGPPEVSGSSLPAIVLARDAKGGLERMVSACGVYDVSLSNVRKITFKVNDISAPLEIPGPWEVRFPAGMDVPEKAIFERLLPLDEHPDAAIRHFAGTVTYARAFDRDSGHLGPGRELFLDLGRVEGLAEVVVNGKSLGVLWKPPFVWNVTGDVKSGANALEVRVTGVWRNRLIGDKKYPDGFPGPGRKGLQFKPGTAVDVGLRADEPLVPSGLVGPVRWLSAETSRLRY